MSIARQSSDPERELPYQIVDLNYVSLYIADFQAAIDFYSRVFGIPTSIDKKQTIYGWRMGATWLTVFNGQHSPAPERNPCNTEFAVQVSTVEEVDMLHQALIQAGAKEYMAPGDTVMYVPMRFACVDDPFGVRIDVYCKIDEKTF